MTVGYEVKPDRQQLKDVIEFFEFIGGNSADAVRIAIRKTGAKAVSSTQMPGASQRIRQQVRLKAGYVKKHLKFVKSTNGRLGAVIRTASRGILLSRYSTDKNVSGEFLWDLPPPEPTRGIKVKIKPGKPPQVVTGGPDVDGKPFYLRLKGGRVVIAARRKTAGPKGGKIKVFHAPSLSQVFDDVKDDMRPAVVEELTAQLADAMRYLIAKRQPR